MNVSRKKVENSRSDAVAIIILKPGDAVNFPKHGDTWFDLLISCLKRAFTVLEWHFSSIHYKGFLEDGTEIDNSYRRGQPIYFVLGELH